MLDRVRQLMNSKPWIGWAVAGVLLAGSAFMIIRGQTSGRDAYHPDRLQETVTVRFTDTGDEMTTTRGRLLRELTKDAGQLDPSKGLINPKTGQPTGFLFDKEEWDAMVTRINAEKESFRKGSAIQPAKTEKK
jgi:hypothetical protein